MSGEPGAGETARVQAWRYGVRMRAAIRGAGIGEADPLRPLLDGLAVLPVAVHDSVEALHADVRRQVREMADVAAAARSAVHRRVFTFALMAACGFGSVLGVVLATRYTAAIEAAVGRQIAERPE